MKRTIILLSLLIILLAVATTSTGLFWADDGEPFYVKNIIGDEIEIFGNGLYAHESYFKAPINKGTDAIILFVVIPIFLFTVLSYNKNLLRIELLHLGILSCLLYYSASIAFGVSYNTLFVVYIALFSTCLFTFILGLININHEKLKDAIMSHMPHKAISIFLVLAGLSVLVWLIDIIASIKTGMQPAVIGKNTTEPTFVIDIGVIAPSALIAAALVQRRRPLGYILAIILLTLNSVIGLIVISQTVFQYSYGVILSLKEFIPFVAVFVVMSLIAIVLNIKALKNISD